MERHMVDLGREGQREGFPGSVGYVYWKFNRCTDTGFLHCCWSQTVGDGWIEFVA